mmetsp:Transcript_88527/g.235580  ORF Transcript_88527/g.235580 Transcript_88527/m.235580 type:complete len:95 (-) Transcript_88527:1477-1761(-)
MRRVRGKEPILPRASIQWFKMHNPMQRGCPVFINSIHKCSKSQQKFCALLLIAMYCLENDADEIEGKINFFVSDLMKRGGVLVVGVDAGFKANK